MTSLCQDSEEEGDSSQESEDIIRVFYFTFPHKAGGVHHAPLTRFCSSCSESQAGLEWSGCHGSSRTGSFTWTRRRSSPLPPVSHFLSQGSFQGSVRIFYSRIASPVVHRLTQFCCLLRICWELNFSFLWKVKQGNTNSLPDHSVLSKKSPNRQLPDLEG